MKNKDLFTAITTAVAYHGMQKDKVGDLYILHPLAVMGDMVSLEEKAVAVLHDVLEDTEAMEEDLLDLKIPVEVVEAVSILTRNKEEDYASYIQKIIKSKNNLAITVKIVDLGHNLSRSVKLKDKKQRESLLARYKKALCVLSKEVAV